MFDIVAGALWSRWWCGQTTIAMILTFIPCWDAHGPWRPLSYPDLRTEFTDMQYLVPTLLPQDLPDALLGLACHLNQCRCCVCLCVCKIILILLRLIWQSKPIDTTFRRMSFINPSYFDFHQGYRVLTNPHILHHSGWYDFAFVWLRISYLWLQINWLQLTPSPPW